MLKGHPVLGAAGCENTLHTSSKANKTCLN